MNTKSNTAETAKQQQDIATALQEKLQEKMNSAGQDNENYFNENFDWSKNKESIKKEQVGPFTMHWAEGVGYKLGFGEYALTNTVKTEQEALGLIGKARDVKGEIVDLNNGTINWDFMMSAIGCMVDIQLKMANMMIKLEERREQQEKPISDEDMEKIAKIVKGE